MYFFGILLSNIVLVLFERMKPVKDFSKKEIKVTSIKISEKYKSCPFVNEWQIP